MSAHIHVSLNNTLLRSTASELDKQHTGWHAVAWNSIFSYWTFCPQHCFSALSGSWAPLLPDASPTPSTWLLYSITPTARRGSQSDPLQHPRCVILGKGLHPPSLHSLVSGLERVIGFGGIKGDNGCAGLGQCLVHWQCWMYTVRPASNNHPDSQTLRTRCPVLWTRFISWRISEYLFWFFCILTKDGSLAQKNIIANRICGICYRLLGVTLWNRRLSLLFPFLCPFSPRSPRSGQKWRKRGGHCRGDLE